MVYTKFSSTSDEGKEKMKIIKKAILKKAYSIGSTTNDYVCYRTSAYWPVGTIVDVVSNGKGKGSIVRFPTNEFDPFFYTTARKNQVEIKFIKE